VPVELGFVASLNRPGGNVTGTTWSDPDIAPKLLQILKETKPSARRIAVLRNPAYPGMLAYAKAMDRVAPSLGMQVLYFDAARADEIPAALQKIAASRTDALLFAQDPSIEPRIADVAAFAREQKLVSVGSAGQWPASGGLLSYAPDGRDLVRITVSHVSRILRGAKPADLPVELPAKYQFVVNLKTARAIGATIPQAVLLRADRVIE